MDLLKDQMIAVIIGLRNRIFSDMPNEIFSDVGGLEEYLIKTLINDCKRGKITVMI